MKNNKVNLDEPPKLSLISKTYNSLNYALEFNREA